MISAQNSVLRQRQSVDVLSDWLAYLNGNQRIWVNPRTRIVVYPKIIWWLLLHCYGNWSIKFFKILILSSKSSILHELEKCSRFQKIVLAHARSWCAILLMVRMYIHDANQLSGKNFARNWFQKLTLTRHVKAEFFAAKVSQSALMFTEIEQRVKFRFCIG